MSDLTRAPRPDWLKATMLLAIAGALVFLGGELLTRRWENSLRQTRCTVLSAKTEGRVGIVFRGRRHKAEARRDEDTTVEFHVDGVGLRRTVEPGTGSDFPVGLVLDCWVAGEGMYLDPESARFFRRWRTGEWSFTVVLAGILGLMAWQGLKKSGLEWPW